MLERVAMAGIKLSATQKEFKQLVSGIETMEGRLREIAELADLFRPLYSKKLQPLRDEIDAFNLLMVRFLDVKLLQKGWTSNQHKTMKTIVCRLAPLLFESADGDEMKAIFDRHADVSAAEQIAANHAALEANIEDFFGVDLDADEDELRSPEEMVREARRKMDQRAVEMAEQAEVKAANRRGKKKSIRETKAEQQALEAGKLLKDIYRRLTSAIHPDREPDAAERARKTGLMSDVNKAYESGNLLRLLQLQFQIIDIDPRAAAHMADEKLTLINHTLRRQHQELGMEYLQLEVMIRSEFGLEFYVTPSAVTLQKSLSAEAAQLRAEIKIMRRDMAGVRISDTQLKKWLNDQRQLMREDEQLDDVIVQLTTKPSRRRR